MKAMSTVSVVMCTYNGERYIREQLDSILQQTYPLHELIIQDDCSTDRTATIIQEYAERYPVIKFVRNKKNMGINPNFFSALSRATGDYIAISDQDDIWIPEKIAMQVEAISDKLLCAGVTTPFSDDGSPVSTDKRIPNYSLLRIIYVGCLAGHTLFFRRDLLSLLPSMELRLFSYRCYDAILSMVAAAFDSVVYINQTLVHQRRYAQAATYTRPADYHIVPYIKRTFRLYCQLKPEIKKRLQSAQEFLLSLDASTPVAQDALYMIHLYNSKSFIDFVRLQYFCIKHRDSLFHTSLPKGIMSILRASYFPVSCSDYYRFLDEQ